MLQKNREESIAPQRRRGRRDMKTTKRNWAFLCVLCAAAVQLFFGCDSKQSAPAPSGGAPAKFSLQLNWKPEPQFGGFYAAKEIGAYAKQNLDVEVVPGGVG